MSILNPIKDLLMKAYGPQGLMPLIDCMPLFKNTTGFHYGDYSYPKTCLQRYEMMLGLIICKRTQYPFAINKKIIELRKRGYLDEEKMLHAIEHNDPAIVGLISKNSIEDVKEITRLSLKYRDEEITKESLIKLKRQYTISFPQRISCIMLYACNIPIMPLNESVKSFFNSYGLITNFGIHSIERYVNSCLRNSVPEIQELFALINTHSHDYDKLRKASIVNQINQLIRADKLS